jgi:tetratricopeptide (TPR) repeat protein
MSIVSEVKSWLMQHMGWLLILDNVDDLSLVTGFLPTNSEGRILMTTRAQAMGRVAESLAVEELSVEEGMLLLLRRAKLLAADQPLDQVSHDLRAQAEPIVRALDGLPLALDQAGAYIEETGCSLSEYLALYHKRRAALLNRQSGVPDDYPYTVAGTWSISFQQVEQRNPAAAELLRLCTFLNPDAIPEEILIDGSPWLGPILEPVAADPFLLNEAVQILRLFSLIKRDPNEKLLNIHRLVQAVLKDGLDSETQRLWGERTVWAVNAAFPEVSFDTWRRCERCLPHVQMCVTLIEQYGFAFPEAARLLNHAGWYLWERGIFAQAEQLLLRALMLREQTVGPDHPETAATLTRLANVARDLGHFEQAEHYYQRALAIQERELGPEHPDIATTLYDMAYHYYVQGKYQQAEPLAQRALAIREQVFGSEHPLTADLLNDLANIYDAQGKYEQGAPLMQRALAIFEKSLEPEHPYLATVLNNLAHVNKLLGSYEQAIALYQRAIAIHEHALGPEHPDTAHPLSNLGDTYREKGDYEQAEQLIERALAIREQALGPMHYHVSTSLRDLARVYSAQERYEQAEALLLRSLAILEHTYEPTHPRIANNLYLLARVYDDQGAFEQATSYYQRALAIQQQALGEEHPETRATLEHFAELQRKVQSP